MSCLRKVLLLGSNLASVTDLKRIETPYSLCCDFGGYKTFTICWSGSRVQVWVQVWALQVIWQSPWRLFQKVIEGLEGKSTAKLLGQLCCSACAGWTGKPGKDKHRVFPTLKSAAVAAGSDRLFWGKHATTLAILTQFKGIKDLRLCKFRAVTSHFFFSCEMKILMELARSCCRPKQCPSLCWIFLSVIGLWVKIWHRNKTACSKLIPLQSSRSKSMTCPRKGSLLRLEEVGTAVKGVCSDWNSTAKFRWLHAKAWKQCKGWFWIDCNQSLQQNQ